MCAVHLVVVLWYICSEFCCDVVAYMPCILLRCKGLCALHLFLILGLICHAFCLCNGMYAVYILVLFVAYMQCIFCNINQRNAHFSQ